MRKAASSAAIMALFVCTLMPARARPAERDDVCKIVARAVRPVMRSNGIPGMAVGVVLEGRPHVCDYGVASRATGKPVVAGTLFELGSISKTFTATLAAYAQVQGRLSLSDSVSKHVPELQGSSFDAVSLLNLGTHTTGGLPLQPPDEVTNEAQLMQYFRTFRPTCAPGTCRTYGNPGIGLLGIVAARSLDGGFVPLMRDTLLPALGLRNTFLDVPRARAGDYAQGYTETDEPIRLKTDAVSAEAAGVRSTAADMLRFIQANMDLLDLEGGVQRAVDDTHVRYYRVGAMTQDLVWEQYPYPPALADLLQGNSAAVSRKPNPTVRLDPPSQPGDDVLVNKTGSTNGFAAYVAFVPRRKLGVVLLANRSYPIAVRVTAAAGILTRLAGDAPIR